MSNTKRIPVSDYGCDPTYVDDLCSVEELGGVTHLAFTFLQRPYDEKPERKIVVRLIIPNAVRTRIARALLAVGPARPDLHDVSEADFEQLH
jgi:hypothetical protein